MTPEGLARVAVNQDSEVRSSIKEFRASKISLQQAMNRRTKVPARGATVVRGRA